MSYRSYARYIKEISQYPLLNATEELELAKKAHAGGDKAIQRLVSSNLRLVVKVAMSMSMGQCDIMDLIQEGNIALLKAAIKFNAKYDIKFSTYAYKWVSQYILRFIRSKGLTISMPLRKEELLRRVTYVRNRRFMQKGIYPTDKEVAVVLNVSEKSVAEVRHYLYAVVKLEDECIDDAGNTLSDVIPDYNYCPESDFLYNYNVEEVRKLVEELPYKQKIVINYRYNLTGEKGKKTLKEIGEILGVTVEAVRQMEARAIKQLKEKIA